MLLAIRVLSGISEPTVSLLADHLLIRHHSAVGLIDRLEERGLAERVRGGTDRRQVRVRLTALGAEKLARLSESHREELRNSGPMLVESLRALLEGLGAEDAATTEREEDGTTAEKRSQ